MQVEHVLFNVIVNVILYLPAKPLHREAPILLFWGPPLAPWAPPLHMSPMEETFYGDTRADLILCWSVCFY